MRSLENPPTSFPRKVISPAFGLRMPEMVRRIVVFPAPFGPSSATNSPSAMFSEAPQMICRNPYPAWRSLTSNNSSSFFASVEAVYSTHELIPDEVHNGHSWIENQAERPSNMCIRGDMTDPSSPDRLPQLSGRARSH